jgi:hypothetical protein
MAIDPIDLLKFNLQERTYPYFTEEGELALLLEANGGSVSKASYQGCLLKAEAEDSMEVTGVKLSSNRDYWITLANKYLLDVKAEEAAAKAASNVYITSRQRSDGC